MGRIQARKPAFRAEVRGRREALGLTLEELAERSGLKVSVVEAVECSDRPPSLGIVVALAEGFDIEPRELFAVLSDLPKSALL